SPRSTLFPYTTLFRSSDIHKLMKLMYFADRDHLVKYGFPITGDMYIKLPYGPVPSFSNFVLRNENDDFRDIFSRSGYIISSDQRSEEHTSELQSRENL